MGTVVAEHQCRVSRERVNVVGKCKLLLHRRYLHLLVTC